MIHNLIGFYLFTKKILNFENQKIYKKRMLVKLELKLDNPENFSCFFQVKAEITAF